MANISEEFKKRLSDPIKITPLDTEEKLQRYLQEQREERKELEKYAREEFGIELPKYRG